MPIDPAAPRIAFSERTHWSPVEGSSAEEQPKGVGDRDGSGRGPEADGAKVGDLLDLTVSNPTAVGFTVDAAALLDSFRDARALVYDPDPLGMLAARGAVVRYYADHGTAVDAKQVLLTTSTSEGYSFLFRLLCDPGDEVMVPQPSYPLFDLLAGLECVRLRPYPLFYDHGWWIDFDRLLAAITPRTRALLLVHPNNPTGHFTSAVERAEIERICAEKGIALIVDEVFLDFPLAEEPRSIPGQARYPPTGTDRHSFARGEHPALTFVLSGMSKIAGLPQMKAAWIVTCGPAAERREALWRLEVVADTYLSVNAPVQLALAGWLDYRRGFQQQAIVRARANLATASTLAPDVLGVLACDGGWSAVLRLSPWIEDSPALARRLRDAGVLVHPGSFYGMAEGNRVVVSLLTPEVVFRNGVERIAAAMIEAGA
jgi:alanine-synthesizing transaminase